MAQVIYANDDVQKTFGVLVDEVVGCNADADGRVTIMFRGGGTMIVFFANPDIGAEVVAKLIEAMLAATPRP